MRTHMSRYAPLCDPRMDFPFVLGRTKSPTRDTLEIETWIEFHVG